MLSTSATAPRRNSRPQKKTKQNVVVTMENVTQDIYGDIITEINRMKLSVFDTRFDADSMIAKFTTGNDEDAERLQQTF